MNQGQKVNFTTSKHNYLNIAHGTNKSTIAGILNAKDNNVFLINPNGVIIEKSGIINANRFVASASSMDSKAMQEFANGQYANGKTIDYATFSPVFKPNGGNVVNMGGILNVKNITFQGNKVILNANANYTEKDKFISANNITLEGKEVYVDVGNINEDKIQNIKISADKGSMYLDAKGYFYNPASFKTFNKATKKGNFSIQKYISIGSDIDWWYFAKGWNDNKEGFRNIANEYRLTNNINFDGKNKNYANYCIDGLGCTNMIVAAKYDDVFNKTFDGQGYTLSNINIDTTDIMGADFSGIFGRVQNATFKNIKIDYKNGSIINNSERFNYNAGGFVGSSEQSNFTNISVENIDSIISKNSPWVFVGGFIGNAVSGKFENIKINNINKIEVIGGKYSVFARAGGFVGNITTDYINDTVFDKIELSNIDNIITDSSGDVSSGGFVGSIRTRNHVQKPKIQFSNITLSNIENIKSSVTDDKSLASSGGFFGALSDDNTGANFIFDNIAIKDITSIIATGNKSYASGFGNKEFDTMFNTPNFANIFIYFNPNATINASSNNTDIFTNLEKANISNIQIYHKNGSFNGINNKYSILLKKYNANELEQEFANAIKGIKLPSINTPSNVGKPSLPNAEAIKNENIEFQNEWLNKEVVQAILDDILNGKYRVSINKFGEIQFHVSSVNGVVITLDSIKQSLDFLDKLKEKNSTWEANELKNIYTKYNKALKIKDEFVNAQKHLFDNDKNSFYKTYAEYQKELELYNSYVKKIESGQMSINDSVFLTSLDKINTLAKILQEQRDKVNSVADSLNKENIAYKDYGYTNFKFLGDFATDFVHNPQSPNVDTPNKPELPKYDQDFEQTASLNLIGDNAIEEEEEEKEIDEAAITQRIKTCIVSDNFKTMNPCVVGY
ncbi:two-partner secretion domain-containing protein [Campylobacter peloridis]|uniref:two-partner secretion domain-containing protein n=1 Tax=Campylobacter peloridis TaxID=488546 RepID=UPI0028FCC000|nr:filamentous hemagglutinin N-terminal domain-containing protein [Campylobacter peloridis]